MNNSQCLIIGVSFILALFFLSGCQLFTQVGKKLNLYCPGLKVDIVAVSWSGDRSRDVYVSSYDRIFQTKVRAYFEKKENGFTEKENGDFYDITIDDNIVIARNDHILVKIIEKQKGTAEVIFNESTRRIIIIEE